MARVSNLTLLPGRKTFPQIRTLATSCKKMAWTGLKDKWPGAYKVLKAYTLTNEDQTPMMNAIDQEGEKLEDVVGAWVDANEATWKPWVEAAQ